MAIAMLDPVLDLPVWSLAVQDCGPCLSCGDRVLGMDSIVPPGALPRELMRAEAQDLLGAADPLHLVGDDVPVIEKAGQCLGGELEPLLASAEHSGSLHRL